jgi:hypothetical protein
VPDRKVRFAVDLSKFGAVRNLPGKPGDDAKMAVGKRLGRDRSRLCDVRMESKRKSLRKRLTKASNFDSLKKFAQKRRNKFEDARSVVLSIQKQPAEAVTVEDL